jgi:uncharacterized protein involved in exopolysaccharide biosynthesis
MAKQQDREPSAIEVKTTTPTQPQSDVTRPNVQIVLMSSLLLGIIAGVCLALFLHWGPWR